MTKRLLVIDWDYFFPVVETVYDTPGSDRGQWEWMLYDWGHSETSSLADYFQTDAWIERAVGFQRNDLPLPMTSGLEANWWSRFKLAPGAHVYVADSNVMAAHPVCHTGISSVWLYDAHHDSGYRGTMDDLVAAGEGVTCENWMCAYHHNGVTNLHVRYPLWRREVFDIEPKTLVPVDRAYDDGQPHPLTFHRVFICRSGSWTPPWLDEAFERFVAACPATLGEHPLDELTKRPWGDEQEQQVAASIRAWEELQVQMKARAEAAKAEAK